MWVHFNLQCGAEIQIKLHKIFRQKIKVWENKELVKGAVLTYHGRARSLYVCLNIPSVKEPPERSIQLTQEVVKQIPFEILNDLKKICEQNKIEYSIRDYEFECRKIKEKEESEGKDYYRGASVEETLRFASTGTKIALQILELIEKNKTPWASNDELVHYILTRIKTELGENYFWLQEAVHFVCNPLLFNERFFWQTVYTRGWIR